MNDDIVDYVLKGWHFSHASSYCPETKDLKHFMCLVRYPALAPGKKKDVVSAKGTCYLAVGYGLVKAAIAYPY